MTKTVSLTIILIVFCIQYSCGQASEIPKILQTKNEHLSLVQQTDPLPDPPTGNAIVPVTDGFTEKNTESVVTKLCHNYYLVVWTQETNIVFQIYDQAEQPLFQTPMQANVGTGTFGEPDAVGLPNCDFIITWNNQGADVIEARRFDSCGNGGSVFRVSVPDSDELRSVTEPKISAFQRESCGSYVIAWRSEIEGEDDHILSRVFNGPADETDATMSDIVTVITRDSFSSHDVAALVNGEEYVVAIATSGQNPSFIVCSTDGSCDNTVTEIDENSSSSIAIVALPAGGFAILYLMNSCAFLQVFNEQRNSVNRLQVSNNNNLVFSVDDIDAFKDGRIVATWTRSNVIGRLFDSSGDPITPEFVISDPAVVTSEFDSNVAALDGKFVATWTVNSEDGETSDIHKRSYCDSYLGCGDPLFPSCNLMTMACFSCDADDDCSVAEASRDNCDETTGRCVECLATRECDKGESCTNLGSCLPTFMCPKLIRFPF